MDKVKAFALTIRPLGGITDDQISLLVGFVKKKCQYYFVITEKTDHERHIHAGLFMKDACTRSNVVTYLMRIYKDLSPQEKTVMRSGIKIMYNEDFITKYMQKDDDTVVIERNLPEQGCLESYFPAPVVPKDQAKAKRCSLMYHELERLWYEVMGPTAEVNTVVARNFLFDIMYNRRIWPMIEDDKKKIQVARNLVRWLNKATVSTIELPPFEKEE